MGYAGGRTPSPTYHQLGDHSETVQIDYDPAQITYEELLDVFWNSHRPEFEGSRQYRSAILYHSEEQRHLAEASKARQEAARGTTLSTAIEPFENFTWAEDYHQKFNLRQYDEVLREYTAIYPEITDFVNSTAVTRLNGYVAGYGTVEQAQAELDQFGLSDDMQRRVLSRIQRAIGR